MARRQAPGTTRANNKRGLCGGKMTHRCWSVVAVAVGGGTTALQQMGAHQPRTAPRRWVHHQLKATVPAKEATEQDWAAATLAAVPDGALRSGVAEVKAASSMRDVFEELKQDAEWARSWDEDRPVLVRGQDKVAGWFGFEDLQEAAENGEVGEAGCGVLIDGSWHMKRVGSKNEAVPWPAMLECLDEARTVVLNSADARCGRLAALSLAAIDAFGLPVCINAYATGADARISAPPHTDSQRVLVLQTEGEKMWRVYSPPSPRLAPFVDPLARGKGGDSLAPDPRTLVLEATLEPGDVLYVPAGWPHTTATASERRSLHLTLGVDTHIWALDAQKARWGALRRAGLADPLRPELDLSDDLYWTASRKTLPRLGWRQSGDPTSDRAFIAHFIADAATHVEPGRFADADAAASKLQLQLVTDRLLAHADALCAVQRRLYQDVVFQLGTQPIEARVATHMAALEKTQDDLAEWFENKSSSFKAKFKLGAKVKVDVAGSTFDAVIDAVHLDGPTYDVLFFDGDLERAVPEARISSAAKKKNKKSSGSKSGFGAATGSNKKKKRSR